MENPPPHNENPPQKDSKNNNRQRNRPKKSKASSTPDQSPIPPQQEQPTVSNNRKMGGGNRFPKNKNQANQVLKNKEAKATTLSAAAAPFVPSHEKGTSSVATGVFCTICSDEVSYLAIGSCNHPICSLCSLRLRYKNKNDDCAICKTKLSVVVVYDCMTHPGEVRFSDLGISETDDIFDGPPPPGTQVDASNHMVYLDCRDHYISLTSFKRMTCPCVETKCSYEGASYPALIQHLNSAHDGLTMCSLCLENRPLFMHEHEVMTKKELQAHMLGMEKSPDAAYFRNGTHANKFTTGHPKCEFCKTHLFDQLALYNHLQREHFTCHLCDETMMFRYYQDVGCLRDHHRRQHFMCELCDEDETMANSDVCYSFRTAEEYRDHLRGFHAVRDPSRYISAVGKVHYHHHDSRSGKGGKVKSGKVQDARRADHFDLDVGSANPFSQDLLRNNNSRNSSSRRQGSSGQQKMTSIPTSASSPALSDFPALGMDDFVPSIPPNMRVAGKISGTGRMMALDDSDLALQAMADAAHRQATIRNRMFHATTVPSAAAFPTLSAAVSSSADNSPAVPSTWGSNSNKKEEAVAADSSSASPVPPEGNDSKAKPAAHPLSLVHRAKPAASTAKGPTAEEKRLARNVELAEAWGIASKDQSNLTSDVIGGTTSNQVYRKAITESLARFRLPATVLFSTLYPPEMIIWAKKNHNELCKVERRLHLFLQDPKASSLPLKPMKSVDRLMMHCLAKYYRLNSYEYDPEPYRYVSMSKTVQSSVPDTLLSDACLTTMFSPAKLSPATSPSATIYLQLAEDLIQTWGRSSDRKQSSYLKPFAFNSSMVIFAEVIMQLQELLLQYQQRVDAQENATYEDFSLLNISAVGPTALAIRFRDIPTAQMVERLLHDLQTRATEHATLVQNSTSVAMTLASPEVQIGIFPYYKLFPDFTVLQPPSPPPETVEVAVAVPHDGDHDDHDMEEYAGEVVDSWNDNDDDVAESHVQSYVHSSGVDLEDGDYELVEATVDRAPPVSSAAAPSTALTAAAAEAADDWEQVVDKDDYWAEFLAERRRKAADATSAESAVPRYRPPVPNTTTTSVARNRNSNNNVVTASTSNSTPVGAPSTNETRTTVSSSPARTPVVPIVSTMDTSHMMPDTSEDFALALALQQEEDMALNGYMRPEEAFPDLTMDELHALDVGVTTVGSSVSAEERGAWRRVGKPTAVAPDEATLPPAVTAQAYVPPSMRSNDDTVVHDAAVLPVTTAFVVPTAVTLSEDPALRLIARANDMSGGNGGVSSSTGGGAVFGSTGSMKSSTGSTKKAGNKFTALLDEDEDEDA